MKTIHFEGKIKLNDDDELELEDSYQLLSKEIANEIKTDISSKHQEDEYEVDISIYKPNIFFRFYVSDEKCSLEEAVKGHLEELFGALDIYTTWYGYSEYTIEGYSTDNFTIGNHDLNKILKSYVGKYIHILIDVKD
jgi:hypothetical protein